MKKSLKNKKKINIAFIKRKGLGSGGTERWLQFAAVALAKNNYNVDYYYSTDGQDENRMKYLKKNNVNLIPFRIKKIANTSKREWINTDFWKKFDEDNYDFISTAMYCNTEYPFYKIKKPIIPRLSFGNHVDLSRNILYSFLPSEWIRQKWIKNGGSKIKSSAIPTPVKKPLNSNNLRKKLKLKNSHIVAGFHQRVDDNIFSDIPLNAFKNFDKKNFYFLIMGGSDKYKKQAKKLGLKNIIFLPHNSDYSRISNFLNTLDIFAHGRHDGETYGAVFAEALIHGLPCLSHYTGIDDAHKKTMGPHGLFAKDLNEYTLYLKKLFFDYDYRQNFTKGAKEFVDKNYSLSVVEKKIITSYKKIMNSKNYAKQKNFFYQQVNVYLNRFIRFSLIQISRLIPFKVIKTNFQKYVRHRLSFRIFNQDLY